MPQLDISFYPPQLVWLAITFILLYFAMAKLALPKISAVLEERQDRIENDLTKAERFKNEAEEILATYEKTVADARSEALGIIKQASQEMAEESTKRHATLSASLAEKADAAEKQIAGAKSQAISNIASVAAEVTRDATAKLIGVKDVDEGKLEAALADAMKEQKG